MTIPAEVQRQLDALRNTASGAGSHWSHAVSTLLATLTEEVYRERLSSGDAPQEPSELDAMRERYHEAERRVDEARSVTREGVSWIWSDDDTAASVDTLGERMVVRITGGHLRALIEASRPPGAPSEACPQCERLRGKLAAERERCDTLEYEASRRRLDAKRPPGVAEPGLRAAVEALADASTPAAVAYAAEAIIFAWVESGEPTDEVGRALITFDLDEVLAPYVEPDAPPSALDHAAIVAEDTAAWERKEGAAIAEPPQPTDPIGLELGRELWSLHKLYRVARTRAATSEERYGQALFNTLCVVRPDIAEALRGTRDDPFHAIGPRVDRAVAVIESMWRGAKL